jgi:hypothetical protein
MRVSVMEKGIIDVSPLEPLIVSLRQAIVDFWKEEDRILHRES